MIITCPHCKKQHNIDEKMIPPNVKKAKCKFCNNHFPLVTTDNKASIETNVVAKDAAEWRQL